LDYRHAVKPPLRHSQVDFWKNSKQLGHGTLIALWYEPRSADDPQIIFATVSDRDACKLAGQFSDQTAGPGSSNSSGVRCKLGVTLQDARGTELLVQACLGEGQLASRSGGHEVVLLQASGSFFAVAPMLKALQGLMVLPFSQYLVPALAQPEGEWRVGCLCLTGSVLDNVLHSIHVVVCRTRLCRMQSSQQTCHSCSLDTLPEVL
jgi:hypothetical protein